VFGQLVLVLLLLFWGSDYGFFIAFGGAGIIDSVLCVIGQ